MRLAEIELTILMPCLNEAETLAVCIGKARGYLERPDVTAERFVPDPYGAPGARLYRTGDRGRRLESGDVAFLGRIDGQVKLRGYRIELGEIRAQLASLPR